MRREYSRLFRRKSLGELKRRGINGSRLRGLLVVVKISGHEGRSKGQRFCMLGIAKPQSPSAKQEGKHQRASILSTKPIKVEDNVQHMPADSRILF